MGKKCRFGLLITLNPGFSSSQDPQGCCGKEVGRGVGVDGCRQGPSFPTRTGHLAMERGAVSNRTGTVDTHRGRAGGPGPVLALGARRCLGRKKGVRQAGAQTVRSEHHAGQGSPLPPALRHWRLTRPLLFLPDSQPRPLAVIPSLRS